MKRYKLLLITTLALLLLGIAIDIVSAQDRLSIGVETGFNRGGFNLGQQYTGFSIYSTLDYRITDKISLCNSVGYLKSGSNNIEYKRIEENEPGLVNYRFSSLSLRSLSYFNIFETETVEKLVYKLGSGLMLNYSPDSWIDTDSNVPVDRKLNGTSTKRQFNLTNLFCVISAKIESKVHSNERWTAGFTCNYNIGLFDLNSSSESKGLNSNLLFNNQRIHHNYMEFSLSLKYTI